MLSDDTTDSYSWMQYRNATLYLFISGTAATFMLCEINCWFNNGKGTFSHFYFLNFKASF